MESARSGPPLMPASLSSESPWKCYLCWKINDDGDAQTCACCCRNRAYVPTSVVDKTHAQPLALHGLAAAQHPFRNEQIVALAAGGLDLTAPARDGWTALHCAARLGQHDVVRNLLRCDASVRAAASIEAVSRGGWRALHHAIAGGHVRAVEELVLADADVNAPIADAEDALTPLHLAAQGGHTVIVELLLQCGADAHRCTTHLGRSALHVAVAEGNVTCARLLAAQTDLVELVDRDGISPLQQAHLLPRGAATRAELIKILEAAFRERTCGRDPRLLPSFLVHH